MVEIDKPIRRLGKEEAHWSASLTPTNDEEMLLFTRAPNMSVSVTRRRTERD